jgi:hypothetical protein
MQVCLTIRESKKLIGKRREDMREEETSRWMPAYGVGGACKGKCFGKGWDHVSGLEEQ